MGRAARRRLYRVPPSAPPPLAPKHSLRTRPRMLRTLSSFSTTACSLLSADVVPSEVSSPEARSSNAAEPSFSDVWLKRMDDDILADVAGRAASSRATPKTHNAIVRVDISMVKHDAFLPRSTKYFRSFLLSPPVSLSKSRNRVHSSYLVFSTVSGPSLFHTSKWGPLTPPRHPHRVPGPCEAFFFPRFSFCWACSRRP